MSTERDAVVDGMAAEYAIAGEAGEKSRSLRERIGGGEGDLRLALIEACDALDHSYAAVLALQRHDAERDSDARFYGKIFSEMPEALVVTTAAGVIREANVAAATALGVPRQFLLAKPLLAFVARNDCGLFRAFIRSPSSTTRTSRVRLRPRSGGGVFLAEVRMRASTSHLLLWAITPLGVSSADRVPDAPRPGGSTRAPGE